MSASLIDGRTNVPSAGTAVPLNDTANSVKVKSILITAKEDNSGDIVVGASTVVAAQLTRRGHLLTAGKSVSINAGEIQGSGALDLFHVYIDAEQNNDGVTWMALT